MDSIEDIIAARAATREAIIALEALATTDEQRAACAKGHRHLEKADEHLLPVIVELAGHAIDTWDGDPKPGH
jgi:hypothetical protein